MRHRFLAPERDTPSSGMKSTEMVGAPPNSEVTVMDADTVKERKA